MSDLVSRLLAAIDEVERKARAAGSLQAMWWQPGGRRNGRNTIREFLTDNDPDSVLRLCQAHRDIVAMYQQAKDQPVVRGEGGLDHASAMGRLTTLGLVVQKLAEGYALIDEGSDGE